MNFLGILLALGLERLLGRFSWWGQPVMFLAYRRALMALVPWKTLWASWAGALLLLLPPLALVYEIGNRIANPFVDLMWSSGILLLCLGPRDLAEDVQRLMDARSRNDQDGFDKLSRALQRGPHPDPTHRTLIGALFIQSHERLFGVLLWFFAFGPIGALLYRFASRLPRALHDTAPDSQAEHVAETLHDVAAWIPARITALLYGLAGSLDDALKVWRALAFEAVEWRSKTWAVLAEVSAASLDMEDANGGAIAPATLEGALREVLRMQTRVLLLLLAAFAMFATGALTS